MLLGNDRVLISRAKRSIAKELKKGRNKMVQEKIIGDFIHKDNRIKVRSEAIVGSSPAEEIIKFADAKQIDIVQERFPDGNGDFAIVGYLNDYLDSDSAIGELVNWSEVENVVDRLPEEERRMDTVLGG